jgi:MFS family permease
MTPTAPAVAKSAAAGSWTPAQRSAVIASFLAWMFDAFDFFLLVFVLHEVAAEFGTPITSVTVAIVLTLAMRPIGAFVFGRAADRYGRRPTLVVVIVLYSVLELVSAFSPNLVFLICVRALFGIAMGGVWGVGSSLTMETIPPRREASSRVCCRPDILQGISAPRWFTLFSSRSSGGAACSCSARCRHCSPSM